MEQTLWVQHGFLNRLRPISRAALLIGTATFLAGCASSFYPNNQDVKDTGPKVAQLDTVTDGKAYILSVQNDMIRQQKYLKTLDSGLDAGIFSGVVALGLGTALHWHPHTNTRVGIFTAAVIGLESTLSLKTQVLIIDKGLDALECVKSQAKPAFESVLQYDAVLSPVARDIARVEKLINGINNPKADSDSFQKAVDDLADAKDWLSSNSIPIQTVNDSVQGGVDAVIRATIDQLDSTLPDGSAFSKISLTIPSTTAAPATTPAPQQAMADKTSPNGTPVRIQGFDGGAPAGEVGQTLPSWYGPLLAADSQLNQDMQIAEKKLQTISPSKIVPASANINCPVAAQVTALQLSDVSKIMSPGAADVATVTVTGGTSPYTAAITTSSANLTPQALSIVINGSTITITGSTALVAGKYNLVVKDATNVEKTDIITVSAPPQLSAAIQQPVMWPQNKAVNYAVPGNTFSDPQLGTLTYTAGLQNNQARPSWLNFDGPTRTFSGNPPPGPLDLPLEIKATNGVSQTTSALFTAHIVAPPKLANPTPAPTPWVEGKQGSITIPKNTFSDPQGLSSFTYTATVSNQAVSWLKFDPSGPTFSGIVPAGAADVTITLTGSNGYLTADDPFTIKIIHPPTLNKQTPTLTWAQGQPINGAPIPIDTFNDPQSQNLTYTAQNLPTGVTFDSTTRNFAGTAPATQETLSITITATNESTLSASETVTITVK